MNVRLTRILFEELAMSQHAARAVPENPETSPSQPMGSNKPATSNPYEVQVADGVGPLELLALDLGQAVAKCHLPRVFQWQSSANSMPAAERSSFIAFGVQLGNLVCGEPLDQVNQALAHPEQELARLPKNDEYTSELARVILAAFCSDNLDVFHDIPLELMRVNEQDEFKALTYPVMRLCDAAYQTLAAEPNAPSWRIRIQEARERFSAAEALPENECNAEAASHRSTHRSSPNGVFDYASAPSIGEISARGTLIEEPDPEG